MFLLQHEDTAGNPKYYEGIALPPRAEALAFQLLKDHQTFKEVHFLGQ